MKEVMIKVYSFEELSEEVQNKIAEKERDWFMENDPYLMNEDLKDCFYTRLQDIGYPIKDIAWNLRYSQGDGMAFYGDIDRKNLPKIIKRCLEDKHEMQNISQDDLFNCVIFWIEPNSYGSHYSHYNTMQVNFELDFEDPEDNDKYYPLFVELRDAILEDVRNVSKELEYKGYEIVESYDEEYFKEDLKGRDTEYLEDGRIL